MPSLNATTEDVAAAPASKSVIGIIYPPPEVRNIVDKTAIFVVRNGSEFETRIRQNEINNSNFNFLTVNNPYQAYYRHKVKEFQEGRGQEPSAVLKSGFGFLPQKPALTEQLKSAVEVQAPLEPPPELEFIADPHFYENDTEQSFTAYCRDRLTDCSICTVAANLMISH